MSRPTITFDLESCGINPYRSPAEHIVALQHIAAEMDKSDSEMLSSVFAYTHMPSPRQDDAPRADMWVFDAGQLFMFEFKTGGRELALSPLNLREEWNRALLMKGLPVGKPDGFKQRYIPWSDLPAFVPEDGTLYASYRDNMTRDQWRKEYLGEFSMDDREDFPYRASRNNRGRFA